MKQIIKNNPCIFKKKMKFLCLNKYKIIFIHDTIYEKKFYLFES